MHHYKNQLNFSTNQDLTTSTFANIQKVLRLHDLSDISDSTHYLIFHMIGLFSFGKEPLSLQSTVDFVLGFFQYIGLDERFLEVTIHPDKYKEHSHDINENWLLLYSNYLNLTIKKDSDCLWSSDNVHYDYCTEFYYHGIEIGNVVLNNGRNIDVGLGLERIVELTDDGNTYQKPDVKSILIDSIVQLDKDGIQFGHYKHGYIFKKLIVKLIEEVIKDGNFCELMDNEQIPQFIQDLDIYQHVYNNRRNILLMFLHNRKLNTKIYRLKDDDWWMITHNIPIQVLRFFRNNEMQYQQYVENLMNFFHIDWIDS